MNNTVMAEQVETKVAGFASKQNSIQDRIARDEQELEELVNGTKEEHQEATENTEEPTTAEERSFKKRYGDLRRHSQDEKAKYESKIKELQQQLTQTTEKEIKLPKTEEEIESWARKYPDVAAIIETIAMKKAREQSQEIESRVKVVDEMRAEAARQKAEAELLQAHPDFDKIRNSEEFHAWAETQPSMVQDALYNNDTDADLAAWAITLYKNAKGMSTKQASGNRDAARAIGNKTNRGAPQRNETGGTLTESQIQKMSDKEYELRQDEIMEAMRTGKFIYDISGSAR